MRIAAGVLLIIMSLLNGCAGFASVAGGAIMANADGIGAAIAEEAAKDAAANGESADEAAKASAEIEAALKGAETDLGEIGDAGSMILLMGIFMLVLMVLQLISAIFCFTQKGAMLIMITAGLTLVIPVVSLVTGSGAIWSVAIAAIVAGLAFMAAKEIKGNASASA